MAQNILTWQRNSTDEQGFLIWRNPNAVGAAVFGQIATVGAAVLTYTDIAVVEGSNYCYEVAAFNVNGASGFSNIACRTVPDVTVPVVTIQSPVPPTFSTLNSSLVISGIATDNANIAGMFWFNNLSGGFGSVTFSAPNWNTVNLVLLPGVNTVTISAFDGASPANIGTATIQIILGVPVVASPLAIRPFMS